MTALRLGPLLRYVDEDTATVWVETDGPAEAEVRCTEGTAGGSARTWQICGHHYALITVVGLEPGSETPYELLLDGERVWPLPGSPFPPSTIRTPVPDTTDVTLAFGSCRWASRPAHSSHDPVGPDALDALAQQALAGGPRPDVLLLLGDQVYADETSEKVRSRLARRRDLAEPPWDQVADFEEYTELYDESWLDPEVRWLLSTVPSCMIFDDHDVIDDWNTSEAWQRDIRATSWWRDRILGGLSSYWVYQHLGNLSPGTLAEDPLFAAIREAEDGTKLLYDFVARAEDDPRTVRWSYRRDFGRVRLLMADTRGARRLAEQERGMLRDSEMAWLREQALDGGRDGFDHLLIGTSLPWLLPPAIHDAETWNAALCAGARGDRLARLGERVRRAADLEHWSAFPRSFRELSALVEEVASGDAAPATVCVLSGDVHHAYVAEPEFTGRVSSRVLQLTCSPMHNSIPAFMRAGFRFGWSGAGRVLGTLLAWHGRTGRRPFTWRRTGGPWFGNQLMTLSLRDRSAHLALDQARPSEGSGPAEVRDALPPSSATGSASGATALAHRSRLHRVLDRTLSSGTGPPAGPGEQSHTGG
ncbi:alkaline phosphatase D family protein [Streptomyces sp. HNM0574]|uniref:alkaline phosphatase D family protein n=1 Tax=Streptomyces sp. HNM0574 TaxID=2714954 RepID=UPI00146CA836|nr:alkaline phosphatase D family protein [Streptomyces sp. HNM0574]NLU69292.1 alkaline phosphatase family protein [Streptomyces sp. HNM0574]